MEITISLPENVARYLEEKWGSLERRALEAIVVEAYREGSISAGKVRELLGMSTRLEADAFLKAKGICLAYDEADFEDDRQTHEQLQREGKLLAAIAVAREASPKEKPQAI